MPTSLQQHSATVEEHVSKSRAHVERSPFSVSMMLYVLYCILSCTYFIEAYCKHGKDVFVKMHLCVCKNVIMLCKDLKYIVLLPSCYSYLCRAFLCWTISSRSRCEDQCPHSISSQSNHYL